MIVIGKKQIFNFQAWVCLLPIAAGACLAVLFFHLRPEGQLADFENFALGQATTSYFATLAGVPIHCQDIDDADVCLEGARQRRSAEHALWLGNSQVHAINQFQVGEENAPPILFRLLLQDSIDLITFSQPNANLQEHYVLFEYIQAHLPLSTLILPVVFDDLRETGLRSEISAALGEKGVAEALRQTAIGRQLLAQNLPEKSTPGNVVRSEESLQEKTEKTINAWLEKNSRLWTARPQIRGEIFTSLYKLRNTVFGIKATSKRRLIKGSYRTNLMALEAIIGRATTTGIKVLLYVVPLRHDVDIPYDLDEYMAFKAEVQSLAARQGIHFVNLEDLVPAELWGDKGATAVNGTPELDFMHFQAGGHYLLAKALYDAISVQHTGLTK